MSDKQVIYGRPNLGCLLGSVYQGLLAELAQALKACGLEIATAEYLVLRAVYDREGAQQCEIAGLLGKDNAAVCRCIKGMVAKGLLRTEPVSHKCLKVYLTDEAKRLRPTVMKVARMRHEALKELLTPEEMTMFVTILNRIKSII